MKDAGNGWNRGSLYLAFNNTGNEPLPPQCLVFTSDTVNLGDLSDSCSNPPIIWNELYIETLEGKTYPVEVSPSVIKIGNYEPILPQIPFRHIEDGWGGYNFENVGFSFAKAAHPSFLVFKGATEIRIDLTTVPQKIPPPNFDRYVVKSISEIVNERLLKNESTDLKAAFTGTCFYQSISGFSSKGVVVPYSIINQNQLDEATGDLDFNYAAYYPGGVLEYGSETLSLSIGPAQNEELEVMLLDKLVDPDNDEVVESEDAVRASHLIVFLDRGDITVYELDCPQR